MLYVSKLVMDSTFKYDNIYMIDKMCGNCSSLGKYIHKYVVDDVVHYCIDGKFYLNSVSDIWLLRDILSGDLRFNVKSVFHVYSTEPLKYYNRFLDYVREQEFLNTGM